jgi:hypothetical protein
MNQKTIAIGAVLMAATLAGISAITTFAYAEYDDCEFSIETRMTVCEGNGVETTYGAAPMAGDEASEETMGSLLPDDSTGGMTSTADDAEDAEDEAEDAEDEEEDEADDAEDDADEAEDE